MGCKSGKYQGFAVSNQITATDTRPINSAPYHTGPKARVFTQREVNKMLDFQLIEPAQTKEASPIQFAATRMGHFASVSSTVG